MLGILAWLTCPWTVSRGSTDFPPVDHRTDYRQGIFDVFAPALYVFCTQVLFNNVVPENFLRKPLHFHRDCLLREIFPTNAVVFYKDAGCGLSENILLESDSMLECFGRFLTTAFILQDKIKIR